MQAPTRERGRPLVYQVHDLISIPEDVPELGIERGDEGIIRDLVLLNESVAAFVEVSYSTGQTKGWILVEVMPEEKVLSYTWRLKSSNARRGDGARSTTPGSVDRALAMVISAEASEATSAGVAG